MRILLFPVGSYGDVYPLIGLGLELKKRGHEIIVCSYGYFEDLSRNSGLDFKMVGSREQYIDTISHPDLWNPVKSFLHLFKKGGETVMRGQYDAVMELNLPGETLIVASCLATGARLANEKLGVPLISVLYQPTALWSNYETPRLYGLATGKNVPRVLKRVQYLMLHILLFGPSITRGTNRFRKELGLRSLLKIDPWLLSEECILNLFPEWFAPRQPDWPENVFYGGFPLWDGAGITPLQSDVQEFMENGSPPVIFTPGTANMHAEEFFKTAAEVCSELGIRGVFLSRFSSQIPGDLPKGVVHFEYAPLSRILSSSAAIVHHGGVGTTAQAFSCGTPQIIMPFSFDQFDNAERMERLGAGFVIKKGEFGPKALKKALAEITEQKNIRQRCSEIAALSEGINPVAASCDIIEEFISRKFG